MAEQGKCSLACGRFYFCLKMFIHLQKQITQNISWGFWHSWIDSASRLSLKYSLCDVIWNLNTELSRLMQSLLVFWFRVVSVLLKKVEDMGALFWVLTAAWFTPGYARYLTLVWAPHWTKHRFPSSGWRSLILMISIWSSVWSDLNIHLLCLEKGDWWARTLTTHYKERATAA